MSITQSVCAFVALGLRHAMRMRHIIICGLSRSTVILTHYLINGTIFETTLHIKCVFRVSLQCLTEIFIIIRRNERDMIENV
jgi:DNA repair protein RadC